MVSDPPVYADVVVHHVTQGVCSLEAASFDLNAPKQTDSIDSILAGNVASLFSFTL